MCVGYSAPDCFDAVKFRFRNKERRLSYVDCLGYVLAKRRGATFVTGDKEFSDLPNVTFVRA